MYRRELLGKQDTHILNFISSLNYDIKICKEVKKVIAVHVLELYYQGYINRNVASKILKALCEAPCVYENYEDLHEAIEFYLKEKVGEDAFWQNLGKSRNDQVITAIRLKCREELVSLLLSVSKLQEAFLSTIKEKGHKPFVLNTHFQPAQPSTFGHYLLSFAEELNEVIEYGLWILTRVNLSPLGSGAVAGSTVKLNREREASLLCFHGIICNTLYATHSRGFFLDIYNLLIKLSLVLKRLANDVFYLSHPSIKALSVPKEHLATSSMMPHKSNPATAEVARARLDKIIGFLVSFYTTYSSLTSGYNLDMQELTPSLWESFDIVKETIGILISLVKGLDVGEGVKKLLELPITASDKAEEMSMGGIPFRKAYFEVAKLVREGKLKFSAEDAITSIRKRVNEGSPGNFEICVRRLEQKLNLYKSKITNFLSEIKRCDEDLTNKIRTLTDTNCVF